MTTLEDQILSLVASGRLSPDVADELLSQPRTRPVDDIVATGAAVRLPGASTLDEMWEFPPSSARPRPLGDERSAHSIRTSARCPGHRRTRSRSLANRP